MPTQKKITEVHSPHPDAAKNQVLELQYAVSELKVLVTKLVLNGENFEEIKSQAVAVINQCVAKLGPTLGFQNVQRTLLNTFNSDYYILKQNMKVIDEHYSKKVPGYAIDPLNLDASVNDQSIRNFWTDQKRGSAVIKDYRKQVAEQLKLISATAPIVPLNDKDGNHYKMSARNYAEMTVRHQANLDDIENLKEEGVDLVWTSSHVDASKRCEPYQGKLYSISGKTGTTKDGIPYTPLDYALLGPKGDGNGIINGYNCRHYLIPYVPGSTAPIEYDKKEIAEERKVNERQRQYENQIRQLKLQQKLAKESGNDELAERLSKRWHKLDLNYQAFSLENGRQFYRWRTVVGRDENIEPNKWGEQQAEKINEEIKNEAAIKRKNIDEYQSLVKSSAQNPKRQYNVDNRILSIIDPNEIFKTFSGEEVKIREFDSNGNTGAEHLAAAKHEFAEEDIKFIQEALIHPDNFIPGENGQRDEYYLKGTFGINKDKKYLHVSVGYDRNNTTEKVIISAFLANRIGK